MSALPTPLHASFTGTHVDDQASRLRALVNAVQPGSSRVPMPTPDPALRRCPVIAVTSGKGGVGKTSTCVNLAISFATRGCRATLLDADLGLANADVMCGLSPTTRLDCAIGSRSSPHAASRLGPGATGRPEQRRSLAQIAVEAPGGFRLVPGAVGLTRMANLSQADQETLVRGLVDLERMSDLVIIDTGAGIGSGVTSFVEAADLALVVVTPEPTSIADAYALIKCVWPGMRARGACPGSIALCVNNVLTHAEAEEVHARIAATCTRFLGFTPPLAGSVRHDEAAIEAVRRRVPLLSSGCKSLAGRDITDLTTSLARLARVGGLAPVKRGFWARFLGR